MEIFGALIILLFLWWVVHDTTIILGTIGKWWKDIEK